MPQQMYPKVVLYKVTYFATTMSNAIGVSKNVHAYAMTRLKYACIIQSVHIHSMLCFHHLDNFILHDYASYRIKICTNKNFMTMFIMHMSLLRYKGTVKRAPYFTMFRLKTHEILPVS